MHFNLNANSLFSQNFNELPTKVRDSLLIKIADRALEKYGPDYNRRYLTPIVKYEGEYKGGDHKGESFYTVTYPYDKTKEQLEYDYSAQVYILNKTGIVTIISFGNGFGYFVEKMEKNNQKARSMPFDTVKKREIFKF
jgi:hypothetical protein